MRFIYFLLAFTFSLVLGTGCKSTDKSAAIKRNESSKLSDKNTVDFQNLFYNGSKEKILGNYEMAINLYLEALKIDNSCDACYYELARILEKVSKNKESLIYAKRAVTAKPDNQWYLVFLAASLQKNNMKDEAVAIYEQLTKKYPDEINYYFDLGNAQISAGKLSDAIKTYDKLEEKIGVKPDLSLQKERIYLKLNKVDKAISEIQKLIGEYPKDTQYYSVLAELYQANNLPEKAFEIYKKIQEMEPDNASVHLSLANYYRAAGNKEKTFEELKIAFSNRNLDIETAINILSSYFVLIDKYPEFKEQALTLNKLFVTTNPNEAKAHAIYGDFLYHTKQLDSARQQYRETIRLDKEKFIVWQQLLLIESELGDFKSMLSETEEAMTLFPNQPLVYLFNGIAKIQLKKYPEAVEVLKSGIKQVLENKAMLSQFYAQLGDAYYKLNNHKESDAAFDNALVQDPKNSYVLNNFSYYLSLRGDSLGKAERMSLMSNTLDPGNASFQDTYGWILYKLNKLQDAKLWLEKAMQSGGEKSAVILEHYGDVLFKLADLNKAVDYWKKAKASGEGSEFLDKKIREQKLYE